MHDFPTDFYGYEMRAVVLGYIRPELDYVSKGAFAPRIYIHPTEVRDQNY